MTFVISCRPGFYCGFERALELLPDAGITHVELDNASADTLAEKVAIVKKSGLTIATGGTAVNISKPQSIEDYSRYMQGCADAGILKIFTSIQGDRDEGMDALMARLRDVCAEAETLGLTITMETHPPFAQNGDNAMEVIEAIDSAALTMNFDTANIHYHNENLRNEVDELRKVVTRVGSVHLKDTCGGYHSGEFPVIGQGIVDYPEVFRLCAQVGLEGPYTLELEGDIVGKTEKTPEARHEVVKACTDYLRSIDIM